jgi:polysaccharide biosynthesis/export protein
MPVHQRWLIAAACTAALVLWSPALLAQRPDPGAVRLDPRLLEQVPTDQVLDRLRASGMTRQQARAELQRRGYDPSIADPYFDMLEREGATRGRGGFIDALTDAGLARDRGQVNPDTVRPMPLLGGELDLEDLFGLTRADILPAGELPVFGASFFRRTGTLDEPAFGPVDPSYRLGPGDEVNIILTGAVQDVYALVITREGTLVVPDLGELVVNGLTVRALEDLLRARLGGVYASGLARVSASLGRVRGIEVYVIGDVERPGPYQLSGLSSVLSALYRAGGPARTGSFREIEIRRGNRVVHHVDLYGYLVHGNSDVDVRLQHGDIVFVPPVTRRVRLEGAVRRPALYEVREGEGLRDAIRFAGGPEADAALGSVQIDRVLPPSERHLGMERVVLDVDAFRLLSTGAHDVLLHDGDRIELGTVAEERRNRVMVAGEVRRPGTYGWAPGITLADVLERASGLTDAAYTDRAHVFRLDPGTGLRRLVSAPADIEAARGVLLEDRDSVFVYSRTRLREAQYVVVGGLVQRPGRYVLHEGATVNDIVLSAGGFADGAFEVEAYVARPNLANPEAGSIARTFRVPMTRGVMLPDAQNSGGTADQFVLRHGDRVEIRRLPGYEEPRVVVLAGEVALPGSYVLETRADRLSAVLQAAGGLTEEAHARGVHVVRGGGTLAADVSTALQRRGSPGDVVLEHGDTVRVPRFDPTILVTGAVVHDSTRVLYRPGMTVQDVVREAGGFARDADRRKLTVTHQNGVRSAVQPVRLLRDRDPAPEPGSTVFVPALAPGVRDGPNWSMVVGQVIGAMTAVATLLIALNQ